MIMLIPKKLIYFTLVHKFNIYNLFEFIVLLIKIIQMKDRNTWHNLKALFHSWYFIQI
jgi:hypothetical protein